MAILALITTFDVMKYDVRRVCEVGNTTYGNMKSDQLQRRIQELRDGEVSLRRTHEELRKFD